MDTTRRAAVILARGGQVLIEQRGAVLDPDEWDAAGRRGIVRLRLAARGVDPKAEDEPRQ